MELFLSSPEIALHKSCNTMEDKGKYHKRTQRDYSMSMSMKLEIVGDIEKRYIKHDGSNAKVWNSVTLYSGKMVAQTW